MAATFTLRIPDDLRAWLEGEASRRRRSQAQVVVFALERERSLGEGNGASHASAVAPADLAGEAKPHPRRAQTSRRL